MAVIDWFRRKPKAPQKGVPSFTQREADKLGSKVPSPSVIIYPGVSPSQAARLGGGGSGGSSGYPSFLPPTTTPSFIPSGGGGGSSGGGGGGGSSSTLLQQSFASDASRIAAENAFRQQQAAKRAAEQAAAQQKVVVTAAGVKQNNRTYYGQATVPGTGMSASQYRNAIQQEAIARKDVELGKQRYYDYTITTRTTQPSLKKITKQLPSGVFNVQPQQSRFTYGVDPTVPQRDAYVPEFRGVKDFL